MYSRVDALALGLLADQVCRELEPDILLCVSIVEKNESTLPTVNTEFPSESVVVDQDMSPIDGHAEREKRGIPRIVEALHSASWSRMEFKTQHRPIDTEIKMNDNEPSSVALLLWQRFIKNIQTDLWCPERAVPGLEAGK